jgi:sugar phosphate isomerase/epimerase
MLPIGLQVYSLRDALAKDFDGTMTQVAKMGYEGVELFGQLPASINTLMKNLSLRVSSKHGLYDDFLKDLPQHLDQVSSLGASVLVCAWSMATPENSWERITENLEKFAQAAKKQNLAFAYHNHAHELTQKVGNLTVLDYMAVNAPTMQLEQDIAWLHAGKVNPASYLETYATRTVLAHVKDIKAKSGDAQDPTGLSHWETVELGKGDVDLGAALSAVGKTKSQWLIVEQDNSDDPLRSAKNNLEWLKNYQAA